MSLDSKMSLGRLFPNFDVCDGANGARCIIDSLITKLESLVMYHSWCGPRSPNDYRCIRALSVLVHQVAVVVHAWLSQIVLKYTLKLCMNPLYNW